MFDEYVMVDWSAGNRSGPRPRKDAIWIGSSRDAARYMRDRAVAEAALTARIEAALSTGESLLIGFDFPFAYPRGFGRALTGSDDPLAVWAWFADRVEDSPKANNRFEIAGRINRTLGAGRGPFWGNVGRADVPGLARNKAGYDNPFPEKRACELRAPGAFTCWQLAYAGAVGSQVIMGLPVLQRLRTAFPGRVAVWPFEPMDRPVVLAEIWPGLIDPAVRAATGDGDIRDAVQVTLLSRAFARAAPRDLHAMLAVEAPVEGWIAGLGFEAALIRAAQA